MNGAETKPEEQVMAQYKCNQCMDSGCGACRPKVNQGDMVCDICGKASPNKHQEFCRDLGCSGRLILPIGLPKCTCAADGGAPHEGWCPAALKIGERVKEPVQRREGLKYITCLPDGEKCVGMVNLNSRIYLATSIGMFYLNEEELLVPVMFDEKAFDHMKTCEHGKGMLDYCEPCGRVNGGW